MAVMTGFLVAGMCMAMVGPWHGGPDALARSVVGALLLFVGTPDMPHVSMPPLDQVVAWATIVGTLSSIAQLLLSALRHRAR